MPDPNILFLSANCPFDSYGAAFRARFVADGLRLAGRVTVVPVSRKPWSQTGLDAVSARFNTGRQVLLRQDSKHLLAAVARNLSASQMNTDDLGVSRDDRTMIAEMSKAADLIWVEEVGIADALRVWRWGRTVLDADDLQSRYLRGRSASLTGAQRARAMWQSQLWRRREAHFCDRFDRVVVCSEDDRAYLGSAPQLRVIPNAFDDSEVSVVPAAVGPPRFGFIGILEYEPNRDAVRWFAREVMPHITRALPAAEFRVVGKAGPEFLRAERLPGTALGYVDDPTAELATWSAMVVPIRFGGGTRVKIAEAFARRIPVVSTAAGAFGYAVAQGRELLLADSPAEFADSCVSLARDASLRATLTAAGAECFRQHYSADSVRQHVRNVACEVLEANRRGAKGQSSTMANASS